MKKGRQLKTQLWIQRFYLTQTSQWIMIHENGGKDWKVHLQRAIRESACIWLRNSSLPHTERLVVHGLSYCGMTHKKKSRSSSPSMIAK